MHLPWSLSPSSYKDNMMRAWMLWALSMLQLSGTIHGMPSWNYGTVREENIESVTVRREYLQDTINSQVIALRSEVRRLSNQLQRHDTAITQYKAALDSALAAEAAGGEGPGGKRRRVVPKMTCRSQHTWWVETVGKTLEYLDQFDIHCRHGEFLRQWRMTWGEHGTKKAIRFVCCKLDFVKKGRRKKGGKKGGGAGGGGAGGGGGGKKKDPASSSKKKQDASSQSPQQKDDIVHVDEKLDRSE